MTKNFVPPDKPTPLWKSILTIVCVLMILGTLGTSIGSDGTAKTGLLWVIVVGLLVFAISFIRAQWKGNK